MKAFAACHPAALALFFLSVLLLSMFTTHPVLLGLSLVGSICFCAVLEPPRKFWRGMAFCLVLFLMSAITNPLFSQEGITPIVYINDIPITLEAVLYGAAIGAMLVAVMLWCKCLHQSFTSEKLLFLCGKRAPKLSLVLTAALRFIPLFIEQSGKVRRAQKAMGLYSGKSYRARLHSAVRVLSAVITWSLENAIDTGDSMRARGYGLKGRSHFSLYRLTAADKRLLLLSGALLGVTLAGLLSGTAGFSYYPVIAQLRHTPAALLTYAAFGLLVLLPFIMEVKERLQWKYYVSRI